VKGILVIGSIINRLILAELVKVFLMALVSLTGLFLIVGLISEAAQRGLSLMQVVSIIPLFIPNMLPYTIPATTLFATCVVYGRMSHDNEIVVLKAAGVNILHTLKPAILLGTCAAAVTMLLYYDIIPRTQRLLRIKIMSDAEDVIYSLIKREGALSKTDMQYAMYVREVQGKRLLDVIFKKKSPTGQGYELVARTREARLRVDMDTNQIILDMGRCTVVGDKDGQGAANDNIYAVPMPESLLGRDQKNRTSALTWNELLERRDGVVKEHQQALNDLHWLEAHPPGPSASDPERNAYTRGLEGAKFEAYEHTVRLRNSIDVELCSRPALSVGCLCFVLIGCPVGVWASRSDYLSIFVICFLPTLFVYYPFLLAGMNLAKDGKLPAFIAVWSANFIVGAIAIVLTWRLMRR
jgi:lipopolysaccharide export system permease protein